jgi:exopolysaccharide biosynthesis predicted pyruvyltransferase EpsI
MSQGLTLTDVFEELRGKNVCFVPNVGNAGNALIALGAFHAFRAAGLPMPPIVPASRKYEIEKYDLIVYPGGGNLVLPYTDCLLVLREVVRLGKQAIVLPHSVNGYFDELVQMASHVRIFCREHSSLVRLRAYGFPIERLALSPDLAFSIPQGFFRNEASRHGKGSANCFRTDRESAFQAPPSNNVDISSSWCGDLWHGEQFTESVCRSLAEYLAQYETIETDRLHVAILGAILGRKVTMYPNNYFKNSAVYQYSILPNFPNVVFKETEDGPAAP